MDLAAVLKGEFCAILVGEIADGYRVVAEVIVGLENALLGVVVPRRVGDAADLADVG